MRRPAFVPGLALASRVGAIEAGYCLLGQCASVDFYGSTVPSRSEVAAGSKGSREYVVAHRGEAWAILMEAVGAE